MAAFLTPACVARPPLRTRVGRALLVAMLWGVSAVPALLGRAPCAAALLFHRPCPGCGMTRAAHMLLSGDVAGSLRMHALTVPCALATAALALATVWLTFRDGTPFEMLRDRAGRAAILLFVAVNVAMVVLWGLRLLGWLGGPVPV